MTEHSSCLNSNLARTRRVPSATVVKSISRPYERLESRVLYYPKIVLYSVVDAVMNYAIKLPLYSKYHRRRW